MANIAESERRRQKHWGLLAVLFGLVIQLFGSRYFDEHVGLVFILGTIICVIGSAIHVHAKGRHLAWSVLALYPFIGPIIGLSIKDQHAIIKSEVPTQADPRTQRLTVIKRAVFVVLFVPAVILSLKHFAVDLPARDVGKDVPPSFPIVALTQKEDLGSHKTYLFHMYELPDFMKQHGDFTFLIPEESATQVSARLSSKYTYDSLDNSSYDFMTFRSLTVKKIEEGKLLIEVHARTSAGEADIAGWYEASDKTIVPKRFLYYHDMAKMIPVMLSILVAWLASYTLAFGILPPLAVRLWPETFRTS